LIFFDSHCHFDFPQFDHQREQIWSKAQSLGVAQLLIPSVSPESFSKTKVISESCAGMLWAAGLHPWWVKDYLANHTVDDLSQALIINMQDKKCVALGETGLDAMIDLDLSLQMVCLEVHIKLAQQFSKPLILHSRKTHAEIIGILKKAQLNLAGVVHAFSGSYEQAKAFIDAGFYLGIGGVITYERANKTREAVKKIPVEYLLLETDAPDMPLQGQQGKINSPVNVVSIANHLAELKQEPLDHIARITTENAHRLFGITHAV